MRVRGSPGRRGRLDVGRRGRRARPRRSPPARDLLRARRRRPGSCGEYLRRVEAERLDVPALVRLAVGADAVSELRLLAGRADLEARDRDRVLGAPLVAPRPRCLSLRDGHERLGTIIAADRGRSCGGSRRPEPPGGARRGVRPDAQVQAPEEELLVSARRTRPPRASPRSRRARSSCSTASRSRWFVGSSRITVDASGLELGEVRPRTLAGRQRRARAVDVIRGETELREQRASMPAREAVRAISSSTTVLPRRTHRAPARSPKYRAPTDEALAFDKWNVTEKHAQQRRLARAVPPGDDSRSPGARSRSTGPRRNLRARAGAGQLQHEVDERATAARVRSAPTAGRACRAARCARGAARPAAPSSRAHASPVGPGLPSCPQGRPSSVPRSAACSGAGAACAEARLLELRSAAARSVSRAVS